jgi:hypothetical protein
MVDIFMLGRVGKFLWERVVQIVAKFLGIHFNVGMALEL